MRAKKSDPPVLETDSGEAPSEDRGQGLPPIGPFREPPHRPAAVWSRYARLPATLVILLAVFSSPIQERAWHLELRNVALGQEALPADQEIVRLGGQGRFEEALELFRNGLSEPPRYSLPYLVVVEAAFRQGELKSLTQELLHAARSHPVDPMRLAGAAYALRRMEENQRALQLLTQAVRLGARCTIAHATFVELSQNLGRAREAEAILEGLVLERPSDPFLLYGRAHLRERRGLGARALLAYQEAVVKARPLPTTYLSYGLLLLGAGRYDDAFFVSRLGRTIVDDQADPRIRAALLGLSSTALELMERAEEGSRAFEAALDWAEESGLNAARADLLLERAALHASRGQSEMALRYLDRARSVDDRSFSLPERAWFLYQQGKALNNLGEERAAEVVFQESAHIARLLNDPVLEWASRIYISFLRLNHGETEAARSDFMEAFDESARLSDLTLRSRAISGLANVQERMGRYAEALANFQRTLAIAEVRADPRSEAIALNNISIVYFRLGLPAQALVSAIKATQGARELGDLRLLVGMQQGLAAALAGVGNLQESQRVYEAALAITSRHAPPSPRALSLNGWARVSLELGELERAKEGFSEALELARSVRNDLLVLQALYGLGLSAWRQGQLTEATEHLEEAMQRIESYRQGIPAEAERMSYLETRAQVYSTLIAVMLERDRADSAHAHSEGAFHVVERSRSRALLDILAQSTSNSRAHSRDMAALGQPITVERLRSRALADGDLLLEYSLGDTESVVWAITKGRYEVFSLPPRKTIEKAVGSFLEAVATPPQFPQNPFERHIALAGEVFEMLLGPVRSLLDKHRHLIVSPDGLLHHLPFGTLVPDSDPTTYLMERVAISYVPSASVLAQLSGRVTPQRGLEFLGVAQSAPRLPGQRSEKGSFSTTLLPIPFAKREVEVLARMFPQERSVVYIDEQATETALKSAELRRFRTLHFATHALADSAFPERSAIYLVPSPGSQEDGVLSMAEILNLDLAADLVVLSGCQTGLGRVLTAEGTVGLSWAFLSAGSSSVLVSLWSVNDRSTSDLMQLVYQNLLAGKDRAEALGQAQKAMLSSERRAFRHPYYWAPFVLVGRTR